MNYIGILLVPLTSFNNVILALELYELYLYTPLVPLTRYNNVILALELYELYRYTPGSYN